MLRQTALILLFQVFNIFHEHTDIILQGRGRKPAYFLRMLMLKTLLSRPWRGTLKAWGYSNHKCMDILHGQWPTYKCKNITKNCLNLSCFVLSRNPLCTKIQLNNTIRFISTCMCCFHELTNEINHNLAWILSFQQLKATMLHKLSWIYNNNNKCMEV
jgi:hypothetical protein